MRMQGKTALVTGAATGIGLSIAKEFAHEGARVIFADLDEQRAMAEAKKIQNNCISVKMDVTDPSSIDNALKECSNKGFTPNVLVNNAGRIHVGTILETTIEDLRNVFSVNVEGLFNVSKATIPTMINNGGGVILNMASLSSLTAMNDRFAYSASKAAVMMMTRSIALDFVKQNIRANCICPARVHTEMVDNYLKTAYAGKEEETFKKFSEYQPIGRMIKPEEIAHMAVYLCSDESSMVTGSPFLIDGGVLMGV